MKTGRSSLFVKSIAAHYLCLLIPLYSLGFVASGPHGPLASLCWILPVWSTVAIDFLSTPARHQPAPARLIVRLDTVLLILAAIQFVTIALTLRLATQLEWSSSAQLASSLVNLFAIKVIVGTSSSFSGIVVAHELIHRASPFLQTTGRLLLSLECYEHFATEHIRGHHLNVGTRQDPATARIGESYEAFWKRTVPAQFLNAWRLENHRLGIRGCVPCPQWLHHRVAQGVTFELVLLTGVLWLFGPIALMVFLLQAWAAVRKLEAVNYIQHWGLRRDPGDPHRALSWDTDSWFTLNTLVGLSRHSDHHRHAGRPFHCLQYNPRNPKLPYGYFALVFLSVVLNPQFQTLALNRLETGGRLSGNPGVP